MRENRWLPYAFVALVAAALYLQTLRFDYVFDDKPLIVQNAFLKEPWSPLRAFHHEFWYGTAFVGYYRPLVIASFALNGRILGWGPGWFHLVNVLLRQLYQWQHLRRYHCAARLNQCWWDRNFKSMAQRRRQFA